MAEMSDRKKRVMEHIARSTGKFTTSRTESSNERKQQIMDHIRRTSG
jgi:hypothetical protein